MKSKLLLPVFAMVAIMIQPAYSVTESEFYEMQEQLQNALMKIQALEQVQKSKSSGKKSGVVKTKSKSGLTINTSGGGIKVKSGKQNSPLVDV